MCYKDFREMVFAGNREGKQLCAPPQQQNNWPVVVLPDASLHIQKLGETLLILTQEMSPACSSCLH